VLSVSLSVSNEQALARSRRVMALVRRAVVRRGPGVPGVVLADRLVPAEVAEGHAPRVRLYERPERHDRSGALLWIHGGGMVMGAPEQDDRWLSALARDLGILVVSVDYRLAPEHPYPAGLDDCMAALRWVHGAAGELGIDPDRVAVGGASAGGGLAAAVALRARDDGGPPLCFQLLNYPMLDDRTVLRVDHGGTGAYVWTPASNRFGWSAYLGSPPQEHDDRVYAAPARATDLSGLPPAWIGVGQLDLFHAEDVDYARRLTSAGVVCELVEVPGMYHGADELVPKAARMRAYRQSMVDALRVALT
jgi:acetyl esterase/lipase